MLEKLLDAPAPLHRKFFLTVCLGVGCLLVGVSVYCLAGDRIMLLLSAVLLFCCFGRAASLYRLVRDQAYEAVEGVCIAIAPKLLRKYRKIRIRDDQGIESALLLGKHAKVAIGNRYRFYFKKTQRISLGNDDLDAALSSDCFLGYEEIIHEDEEES